MDIKRISDYPDIVFLLDKDRDLQLLKHNAQYFVAANTKRLFNEALLGIGDSKTFLKHLELEYEIDSLLVILPEYLSRSIREYAITKIVHEEIVYNAFNFSVAYHT